MRSQTLCLCSLNTNMFSQPLQWQNGACLSFDGGYRLGTRHRMTVNAKSLPPYSRYPLHKRLGESHSRFGENLSPSVGFGLWTTQRVASLYADCVTLAPKWSENSEVKWKSSKSVKRCSEVKWSEGECSKVQRREGLKTGCNGKGIYGW